MTTEQNNRKLGSYYEGMAADYLIRKGYRILAKNYRCPQGEIDIVARSPEGVTVFVEVKYRHTLSYGDPLSAVGYQKRARISRASLWYMRAFHLPLTASVRFDVIGITGDSGIHHVENAFSFESGSFRRR